MRSGTNDAFCEALQHRLACTRCNGTGIQLLLNVWQARKRWEMTGDLGEWDYFENTPCPRCRGAAFWGFVAARVDMYGPPFAPHAIGAAFEVGFDVVGLRSDAPRSNGSA